MKIIGLTEEDFKRATEKATEIFPNEEFRKNCIKSVEVSSSHKNSFTFITSDAPNLPDRSISIPKKDVRQICIYDSSDGKTFVCALYYGEPGKGCSVFVEIPLGGNFPKVSFY